MKKGDSFMPGLKTTASLQKQDPGLLPTGYNCQNVCMCLQVGNQDLQLCDWCVQSATVIL